LFVLEGVVVFGGGFGFPAGGALEQDFLQDFLGGDEEGEGAALGEGGGFVAGGGDVGGGRIHVGDTLAEVIDEEGGEGFGDGEVAGLGGFLGEGFLVGGDAGVFLAPCGEGVVEGGVGEEEVLFEELELGGFEVAEEDGDLVDVGVAAGFEARDVLAGRADLDELERGGDGGEGRGGGRRLGT
jgi:hypothetical protein